MAIDNERFDSFLYGMALSQHATYLSSNWDSDVSIGQRTVAYFFGIGEHICYILFKIVTAVAFIFLSIALSVHYLASIVKNLKEEEITKRKIRLFVSCLVISESIPGMCIDCIGVLCPPVAYQIHTFAKEKITRRCFEKWGIIDYGMKDVEFTALHYFAAI